MADEKYFYHSFVSPCCAPEMPCFAKVSGDFVVWLKNADCGKFEHSFASYYYCWAVEMVVKRGVCTTKDLGIS